MIPSISENGLSALGTRFFHSLGRTSENHSARLIQTCSREHLNKSISPHMLVCTIELRNAPINGIMRSPWGRSMVWPGSSMELDVLFWIGEDNYPIIEQTVKRDLETSSLPSGNLKSSSSGDSDRLVHSCHGPPGWFLCYMFQCMASRASEQVHLDIVVGIIPCQHKMIPS